MNEAMQRFDRKMDARRLLIRAATILAGALWLGVFLILMDAAL